MAVVEQVGGVVSELAVSPFTNPEYEGVTAAGVEPYGTEAEEAVTCSIAGLTVTSPKEYVIV